MLKWLITLTTLLIGANLAHASDADNSKAVILAYHRIGEPEHIGSNLNEETFLNHVEEIINNDYNVISLPEVVKAIKAQEPLPPRTIAITFEGAYRSAYQHAIPALIEKKLPFTIFIASESTKIPNHLDWKTLKKISKYDGASFGILPATYTHINGLDKAEATRLINKSRTAFKENMGFEAKLFSYPFGEISHTLKTIAQEQGFDAALGLQSGPAYTGTDPLRLPRFTMTDQYASLDRFRMISNTYPLPIKELVPEDTLIKAPLEQIGFTVDLKQSLNSLSCHISGQGKPAIEILENRVEIIPQEPISSERTRMNCTLPNNTEEEEQSWRWFSLLFHTPAHTEEQEINEAILP